MLPLSFVVALALQVYFAQLDNRWLGRILPVASFLISNVLWLFNYYALADSGDNGVAWGYIAAFLVMNIPTVILILVYVLCRKHFQKKKQLEKIHIQDL